MGDSLDGANSPLQGKGRMITSEGGFSPSRPVHSSDARGSSSQGLTGTNEFESDMVDGHFNSQTQKALKHFQDTFDIRETGAHAATQRLMLTTRHDGLPDFDACDDDGDPSNGNNDGTDG